MLRALIVMLVALNLGVAAWWAWRPATTAAHAPASNPAPGLRLAATMPAAPPAPAAVAPQVAAASRPTAPTATPAAPVVEAPRCLRMGPFADEGALAAARNAAAPLAARTQPFQRTRAARGWRVMLPAQADRAAAQAVVERLRAADIDDLYIVADGAEANSIALGRYGSEASARNREATLRAAGFPARAEPLGPGTVQHWLDVQLQPQADDAAARRIGTAATLDCAAFGNPQAAG